MKKPYQLTENNPAHTANQLGSKNTPLRANCIEAASWHSHWAGNDEEHCLVICTGEASSPPDPSGGDDAVVLNGDSISFVPKGNVARITASLNSRLIVIYLSADFADRIPTVTPGTDDSDAIDFAAATRRDPFVAAIASQLVFDCATGASDLGDYGGACARLLVRTWCVITAGQAEWELRATRLPRTPK